MTANSQAPWYAASGKWTYEDGFDTQTGYPNYATLIDENGKRVFQNYPDLIHQIVREHNAFDELLALAQETLFADEHGGQDPLGASCPNCDCDGAVPLEHSLRCRIKNAIWKATHAPQAVAQ